MIQVFIWCNHNSPARLESPVDQIGSVEIHVVNQHAQHFMQHRNRESPNSDRIQRFSSKDAENKVILESYQQLKEKGKLDLDNPKERKIKRKMQHPMGGLDDKSMEFSIHEVPTLTWENY